MQKHCLCVYSRGFRQITLSAAKAFLRLCMLKILKDTTVYILNSAFLIGGTYKIQGAFLVSKLLGFMLRLLVFSLERCS